MGEWLERYNAHVVVILLVAIVAGGALFLLKRTEPPPIVISTPAPAPTATLPPTPTPAPLRVYVTGAVQRPDVYLFVPGSIVKEALAAAGGATADADLDAINLAVQLQDQQQIYVPRQGEGTPPAPPLVPGPAAVDARSGSIPLYPLNINTASAAELETLPGIGPTYAQRIVEYREENGPFAAIEDLTQVKGIGPSTLAKLEGLITVH